MGDLWAPTDTEELLHAIATKDYGLSSDRSSKLATPAIRAYNKVANEDNRVVQTRGRPLSEEFTIAKVRLHLTCGARLPEPPDGGPAVRRLREMRIHKLTYLLAYLRACFFEPPDGGPVVRRLREMRMHELTYLPTYLLAYLSVLTCTRRGYLIWQPIPNGVVASTPFGELTYLLAYLLTYLPNYLSVLTCT